MSKLIIKKDNKNNLSKTQKLFNSKIKKIEKLQQQILKFDENLRIALQECQKLNPIEDAFALARTESIEVLYQVYLQIPKKQKARKRKTVHLLNEWIDEVIHHKDCKPRLIGIYNDINNADFEKEEEENLQEQKEMMAFMFKQMTGMDIDLSQIDPSAPPEQNAEFFAQIHEKAQAFQEQQEKEREERAKKRKKTPKQIAKEQQQEQEEKITGQSIRQIYMELVKEFHPDRETDEQEKQRKTDIMQKITDAYQNNDLFSLLKLQLDYLQIDKADIENIAEEKLNFFNKILQKQVQNLEYQLSEKQTAAQMQHPYEMLFLEHDLPIDKQVAYKIKSIEKQIQEIKELIQELPNEKFFKTWIDQYTIEEEDDFVNFDLSKLFK